MKKFVSIVLVVLMLFSVVAVSASAALCNCGKHNFDDPENCNCCLNCPNLNTELLYNCVEKVGNSYITCCEKCTGYDKGVQLCKCDCGCEYCEAINGEEKNNEPALDINDFWGESQQNDFVSAFQAALRKVSNVFDGLFDSFNSVFNGFVSVVKTMFNIMDKVQ